MKNKKIIMTGGSGRFAKVFKSIVHKEKIFYPSKKILDIKNLNSIKNYVKKNKTRLSYSLCGFIKTDEYS